MLLATVQTLLTGCRRDLYVIAEHEKQIELITDWSKATQKPGGMTWWFMRNDNSGYNRHETTAAVTHTWLGVAKGLTDEEWEVILSWVPMLCLRV